jgi:hypothetical protein
MSLANRISKFSKLPNMILTYAIYQQNLFRTWHLNLDIFTVANRRQKGLENGIIHHGLFRKILNWIADYKRID